MIGMKAALADLERRAGRACRASRTGSPRSSAAGGLRMVTVGPGARAHRRGRAPAALGAGARLVGSFAYRLTRADVERIVALAPDILLLCRRHRRRQQRRHPAQRRGARPAARCACPVVLAGNRDAADDVLRAARRQGSARAAPT